ncbi:hypothetical protein D3C71_941530 [compost metagenome]
MEYIGEVVSFILGGAAGSLLTLRIQSNKAKNGVISDQSGAKAGGDIVGRDKISK